MNRREYAKAKAGLSKNAAKMLKRIEAGHFYKWDGPASVGPTMRELIESGVVAYTGRVEVWVSAAVPTCGYTPAKREKYDHA